MLVLGQVFQEFDNIIIVGAVDGENWVFYLSYGNGLDILVLGGMMDNFVIFMVGDGLGIMVGILVVMVRVIGAVFLVWAVNFSLNFSQVKEVLKVMVQDLGVIGWDQEMGVGLLDLDQVVEWVKVIRGLSYRL